MQPIIIGYNYSLWPYRHIQQFTFHYGNSSAASRTHVNGTWSSLTASLPLSLCLELALSNLRTLQLLLLKPLRVHREGNACLPLFGIYSTSVTAVKKLVTKDSVSVTVGICYKKPVTNEVPDCLLREHYVRNMTFETFHSMKNGVLSHVTPCGS